VRRGAKKAPPPSDTLSWSQLRQLEKQGWEIGSLGHEPVNLTERSYLEQRRQIARSRFLLSSHLSKAPTLFSYPFGAYDATTVSCLRDQGFAAAVTMRSGLNHGGSEATEPYHLRRLPLSSSALRDLVLVLRHALSISSTAATQAIKPGTAPTTGRDTARTGAVF
jgi:peptidoglycan/xylan/chitin deacetylase (PgdA/CDA1 family)